MTGSHAHTEGGRNLSRLLIVLGLTSIYLVAEVVGGLLTNSLALLADAGHMLTDVAGLALAVLAIRFAQRPPTPQRSYGYYRAEILAALANGVILIGVSLYILYEAYQRFRSPPEVQSGTMLVVAGIGLLVNLAGMMLLRSGAGQNLNVKGAYFEVLSDLLTSIGVIIAAIVMLTTGWYYADPLISAAIGLFILPRTWRFIREATGVLLEGTPSGVDLGSVREVLSATSGVIEIHDLHVWSLTSGQHALSAHAVLADGSSHGDVLRELHNRATRDLKMAHVTIQLEPAGWETSETHL